MIKAIMLDVDGTLVSFETHKVLPSSVDALRKIHDGGIRIVIATGRAAGDLHEIAAVPYDGIIALNGADCVLRDGTVIRKHLIPKSAADGFICDLLGYGGEAVRRHSKQCAQFQSVK